MSESTFKFYLYSTVSKKDVVKGGTVKDSRFTSVCN